MLVGAITFNAILRDDITGTWWRQETGEAAKGALKGHVLDDMPFEQMSELAAKNIGLALCFNMICFREKIQFSCRPVEL